MNKRARLTRRILREHRRGANHHAGCRMSLTKEYTVYDFWRCPRCPDWGLIPLMVPSAYR